MANIISTTERVLQLARDMASYAHHSGYPVYDGGHSEPEEQCQQEDCKAVREFAQGLKEVSNGTR